MAEDNLIIFEMFPDVPYRNSHLRTHIERANEIMNYSGDPVIVSAIENRHPFQATLGCGVFPKGYTLVSAQNGVSEVVANLPSVFDEQVLPQLKKRANPESCLENWILDYEGRGLGLLEDPSQSDRFLYSCLHDLQINHYNPQISQNAIALLQRFGGPREIRALGELAAYAGLEHGSGYMGSQKVCTKPDKAWSKIEELYSLD